MGLFRGKETVAIISDRCISCGKAVASDSFIPKCSNCLHSDAIALVERIKRLQVMCLDCFREASFDLSRAICQPVLDTETIDGTIVTDAVLVVLSFASAGGALSRATFSPILDFWSSLSNIVKPDIDRALEVLQKIARPEAFVRKPFSLMLLEYHDHWKNKANYACAAELMISIATFGAQSCAVDKKRELDAFAELLSKQDASVVEVVNAAHPSVGTQPIPDSSIGKQDSKESPETLDFLLGQLNSLIGLQRVKSDVSQLIKYVRLEQLRRSKGLKTADLSLHVVFTGNPGTGKTTIARLIAKIYKALGVLKKGHLVETDRSGLVAGFVGQTALKVHEVANQAVGGVLFIDEAYALKPTGANAADYGQEAIETLLKFMEDHREELVVVVAGYPAEMDVFLRSNPGLQSRFNKFIHFDDYDAESLMQIFQSMCKETDYFLSSNAEKRLLRLFQSCSGSGDRNSGNGRLARNLFERSISNLASRIVFASDLDDASLMTITEEDIPTDIVG